MNVADLLGALDSRFPFASAGAWDRVGLQIGGTARSVTNVGVCHEVTPGVVDEAESSDIDVVVSYHPLLFRPTTSIVEGTDATGRAMALVRSGTSLISIHTAFDVARPGTADAMLAELGLSVASTFGPVDDEGGEDIGRIAHLPEPRSIGDLVESVSQVTGDACRYNVDPSKVVASIGVIPGSGDSFVPSAIGNVDCLISGDISHHGANTALAAGMAIIDAGHVPSERAGVRALYAAVCEVVPGATSLSDDAHPWRA